MKALTLHRPWPACVVWGAKRIENRGWAPPASLVGQRIAIHAGKTMDESALAALVMHELVDEVVVARARDLGIVGVATLLGWVDKRTRRPYPANLLDELEARSPGERQRQRTWWVGPVAWWLGDVVALAEPVPCSGAQGLWTLPPDVEAAVLQRLAA